MTDRQALAWLFSLTRFGVKLGLDNVRALLADLGHPERAYPTLLVTGTNGKGSVTAMLSAALRASGLRVGTYTSPHLVRFGERVAIDGAAITPRRVADLAGRLAERIAALLARGQLAAHPTFFEVTTALALVEFARRKVDVAVLEIGLGGRFDATNAADPVVSVITSVALEHTRWLGDTVAAIAFEKSGIARPGRPLVSGVSRGEAAAVIGERARSIGAELVIAPRRVHVRLRGQSPRGLAVTVSTRAHRYPRFTLPLLGRHQIANLRVAVAALEALPGPLRPSPAATARGLSRTRWPGRIEYVAGRPPILLDGAHNPHAARALAAYLGRDEPRRPKVLVFGCLGDKDVAGVLRPLAAQAEAIVLTSIQSPRALAPEALRRFLPVRQGPRVEEAASVAAALSLARRLAGPRGLVVVSGSLYLVGEVKARLAGVPPPDQG